MNEVRQQVATVLDGAKRRITSLNRKRLILAVTISTLWAISAAPEQLEARSSADVILGFLVFFPIWCALVYLAISGLETWRVSRRADKQPKPPSTPWTQDGLFAVAWFLIVMILMAVAIFSS